MVEQTIPMLGLENLQHAISPSPVTIPEKVLFIIENIDKAFSSPQHRLTVLISFGSLAALLFLRTGKRWLANWGARTGRGRLSKAVYLPEVFVVVLATTGQSHAYALFYSVIVRQTECMDADEMLPLVTAIVM